MVRGRARPAVAELAAHLKVHGQHVQLDVPRLVDVPALLVLRAPLATHVRHRPHRPRPPRAPALRPCRQVATGVSIESLVDVPNTGLTMTPFPQARRPAQRGRVRVGFRREPVRGAGRPPARPARRLVFHRHAQVSRDQHGNFPTTSFT